MRRRVRATEWFFRQVDAQLPAEPGGDGTPSRNQFEAYDLFDIIDRFATGWDELEPAIDDRDDLRQFIGTGRLVATFTVTGLLAADGWIELMEIEIQVKW